MNAHADQPQRPAPLKDKGSITPHRASRCYGPAGTYMPFSLISASRRREAKDHLSFRKNVSLNASKTMLKLTPASRLLF